MGKIYKQSVYGGLFTILGILLGVAVTLLSMRFFPQEELGFTQNLIRVTAILSQLGILGFHMSLLIKGQAYEKGTEERAVFFTYTFCSSLLGLSIIGLILWASSAYFPNIYKEEDRLLIQKYFILFPLLTFLSGILLFFESWLQGNHKTSLATFSRETITRILYIGLIFLYGFDILTFETFITSYVAMHLLPLIYLYFAGHKIEKIALNFNFKILSKATKRHLWSFSTFHLFAILSLMLVHQLDILLLAPLSNGGLKDVAIYSIAALVINMLRGPMRTIATAITPSLSEHYHKKDYIALKNLFNTSRINAQLYAVFTTGLIAINIPNMGFFLDFIQEGYEIVPLVVGILLIGQFFEMLAGFNHELIGVSNAYKINFWLSISFAILLFILHFFMISSWGIVGAAIATSIGFTLYNLLKSWFIYRYFKFPMILSMGWKVIGVGAAIAVIIYIIPNLSNTILNTLIKSGLFASLYWIKTYRLKSSAQLVQITNRIFPFLK